MGNKRVMRNETWHLQGYPVHSSFFLFGRGPFVLLFLLDTDTDSEVLSVSFFFYIPRSRVFSSSFAFIFLLTAGIVALVPFGPETRSVSGGQRQASPTTAETRLPLE